MKEYRKKFDQETYRRGSRSHEDERAKVSSALVAERACRVDQGSNTIRLDRGADERRAPGRSRSGSFLGLEELFFGVGFLGTAVGLAEEGSHDGEGGDMVEDGAERDGGGLDGWEVWGL